jgi:hypothetical protein
MNGVKSRPTCWREPSTWSLKAVRTLALGPDAVPCTDTAGEGGSALRFRAVPEAGHHLMVQSPTALAQGLNDFFTRHPIAEVEQPHPARQ